MFVLNDNFAWLVWVPFGMSLSLLPMPRCLLLVVPTILLAMGYYGGLPDNFSPPELLKFATFAMGLAVYCAVIYLPLALLRGRFQREWTFHRLEQSHRDLEEAHQQLEEAAVHERELAVLRERGRLARDMHDTLGHSLALIAVKLEAAQRLRPVDPDRADHEVVATQAIARDALAELRAAIADLRVPGNARATLCDALIGVAQESASRAGWRLTCEVAPDVEPMGDQTRAALLRTSHEALANIERHAHAHDVHVSLTRQGNTVVLRIEDDGVGILTTNPPRRVGTLVQRGGSPDSYPGAIADVHENEGDDTIASPQGHYGITGMRERTMGAGGAFMIGAGADGRGTCVEVRLPASAELSVESE
jgi:signal transduction histidine kinase